MNYPFSWEEIAPNLTLFYKDQKKERERNTIPVTLSKLVEKLKQSFKK